MAASRKYSKEENTLDLIGTVTTSSVFEFFGLSPPVRSARPLSRSAYKHIVECFATTQPISLISYGQEATGGAIYNHGPVLSLPELAPLVSRLITTLPELHQYRKVIFLALYRVLLLHKQVGYSLKQSSFGIFHPQKKLFVGLRFGGDVKDCAFLHHLQNETLYLLGDPKAMNLLPFDQEGLPLMTEIPIHEIDWSGAMKEYQDIVTLIYEKVVQSDIILAEEVKEMYTPHASGARGTELSSSHFIDEMCILDELMIIEPTPLDKLCIPVESLIIEPIPLAKGISGAIHRADYLGVAVAVKKLFAGDPELQKELAKWSHFRHPNIVQLIGFSRSKKKKPLIVMELMERSLYHHLQVQGLDLSWPIRLEMALKITAGLRYLHEVCNVIHRDIKSLNILVKGVEVKIADFGTSRGSTSMIASLAGTHRWVAPELYAGKDPSFAGDVYALGVVFNELLTRKAPFIELGNNDPAIMKAVTSGQRPNMVPSPHDLSPAMVSPFIGLIQDCWHQDPLQRPSIALVFQRLTSMAQSTSQSSSSSVSPGPAPDWDGYSFSPPSPHPPSSSQSQLEEWTLQKWLTSLQLDSLIPIFEAEELTDRNDIKDLSSTQLRELGIKLGPVIKIIRHAKEL